MTLRLVVRLVVSALPLSPRFPPATLAAADKGQFTRRGDCRARPAPPANVERDRYRHPAQTLSFFGSSPTDTVVEIWPGGGWYTEILAPYLARAAAPISRPRPTGA